MQLAIVTAGGAGMFCGSCMHDNTWAKALRDAGHDVTLLPTYTPLTLDESDQSEQRVFLGGINVYLDHKIRLWSRLPRVMHRLLDARWLLKLAGKLGVSNDASELGPLTLDMLAGSHGVLRAEVEVLVQFLAKDLNPDAILFSNALLSGVVPALREQYARPIWCMLQGDDIFLNGLVEPYRSQAIAAIAKNGEAFTGFLTHSLYYADYMADLLSLPRHRFHAIPLSIDLRGHDGLPRTESSDPFTVGYFARICPEKGLHELWRAFEHLHDRQPQVQLVAGGYLGKRDLGYLRKIERQAEKRGARFRYAGSPPTHEEKVALLKRFDLLSVPTTYREPKGLYLLEALANGIPVVQPDHGAFPELIRATGGGLLFPAGDAAAHAAQIERLMINPQERVALGIAGQQAVREQFSLQRLVAASEEVFSADFDFPVAAKRA